MGGGEVSGYRDGMSRWGNKSLDSGVRGPWEWAAPMRKDELAAQNSSRQDSLKNPGKKKGGREEAASSRPNVPSELGAMGPSIHRMKSEDFFCTHRGGG